MVTFRVRPFLPAPLCGAPALATLAAMQIFGRTGRGTTIILDVDATDTVDKVCRRLHGTHGIPSKWIELQSSPDSSSLMRRTATLRSYRIADGSTVYLAILGPARIRRVPSRPPPAAMQVSITTERGQTVILGVAASDTVGKVCRRIYWAYGIPSKWVELYFSPDPSSRMLRAATLWSYRIAGGSTVYMAISGPARVL